MWSRFLLPKLLTILGPWNWTLQFFQLQFKPHPVQGWGWRRRWECGNLGSPTWGCAKKALVGYLLWDAHHALDFHGATSATPLTTSFTAGVLFGAGSVPPKSLCQEPEPHRKLSPLDVTAQRWQGRGSPGSMSIRALFTNLWCRQLLNGSVMMELFAPALNEI